MLSVALAGSSVLLYALLYRYGGGRDQVVQWLLGSLAFLPVQVLLVTLVVDRLLARREKLAVMKKLNMVIGAFFSEAGTELLGILASFDPDVEGIRADLVPSADWSAGDFARARARIAGYDCRIDALAGDLPALKAYLAGKREFLLALLGNPNLLEHESFTDLLWAIFHLAEELVHRDDLRGIAGADAAHLGGDIRRAYLLAASEWVAYLAHLREDYPYLHSLAVRTNPLDPSASVEIR